MDEVQITPELEALINKHAQHLGINPDRLRYYVQYGAGAPQPPSPPSRWRRMWWWLIDNKEQP